MNVPEENIKIRRDTSGTVTFKPVRGNYTNRENFVTMKKDIDPPTSDKILEFSSLLNQVHCVYSSSKNESTFSFDFLPEDTADLIEQNLDYDIESIDPINPEDKKVPKSGKCKIEGDVRNPLSGISLPSTATRFVNLSASEAEIGDLIQCKEINGIKVFTLITLEELKIQLDNL